MDKLRAAIMGKRGKNLDDLQFMTGTINRICFIYYLNQIISRVLPYGGFRVFECSPPQVREEDSCIQVGKLYPFTKLCPCIVEGAVKIIFCEFP